MSEFSESYHLRSEQQGDAIEILRSVQCNGYVYRPSNGWVTFLAEGSTFEPDERIVAAAVHPLLHYVYAEDYGWGFTLYNHGAVVSRYHCNWGDDELHVDDSEYSRANLQQVVPSVQLEVLDDVEQWLHPHDIDELLTAEPAKLFAHAVGLVHYNWLSYDYIERDSANSPEVTWVAGA
ncbi:hypothetical protein [Parathermosynechococcus lividus]